LNNDFANKNKVKNQRVSNYMNSTGIKDSLSYEGKDFNADKITNFNKETLIKNVNENGPNMKYKTNAAHVFDGKKGYYL